MSSGGRQRMNPADSGLARLADLAARGMSAGRMAREVDALVSAWLGGEQPASREEVAERLATMHEQLVAGASAAAEQVGDIAADDPATLRHAKLVHAALEAAVEAVSQAQAAQHPAVPQSGTTAPMAMSTPPDTVTIDPLARQNPQGVDRVHAAELWLESAAEPLSQKKPLTPARPTARKKRSTRGAQGSNVPSLIQ